jgi:hypothetical protein
MRIIRKRFFSSRISLFFLLFTGLLIGSQACSSGKAEALNTVQDYLKPHDPREVKLDSFYTSLDFPDRAYISVTVTYNFATGTGAFQKEYLGFVLQRAENGWTINKNTSYTTEESEAKALIAGRKR